MVQGMGCMIQGLVLGFSTDTLRILGSSRKHLASPVGFSNRQEPWHFAWFLSAQRCVTSGLGFVDVRGSGLELGNYDSSWLLKRNIYF